MIAILDYGMGNPSSIQNMVRKVGGEATITNDIDHIRSASAIVLPGVGAFDNGMEKLKATGMLDVLTTTVMNNRIPFLGICLGMQLLFECSEEGCLEGLGWLPGRVRRFDFARTPDNSRLKIPHMGWNVVRPIGNPSLFKGLNDEACFYFVHSYHVDCSNEKHTIASSSYGYEFTSAVRKDHIWGVQFHPEKSHRFGMALFKNFLEITKC